jgi:hypothetical protein
MKTIKVRIALAVDKNGKYAASGYSNQKDADAFSFIVDDLESGEARYFVEVEVPLPAVEVVKGEVVTP